MKYRVISMLLVLVLALALPVRAAEGDWTYEQTEDGLRLTGYLGTETELVLPDTLAGQRVVEIGKGCFKDSKLTEVTIPHGIRVIGEEAFCGSSALTKVYLSGSVNVIGDRAFANSGLIKMDIPGSVRAIGNEAFRDCEKMFNFVIESGFDEDSVDIGEGFGSGSVSMEEGVESIGDRAFYGCTNLTRMFVPASVTTIGSQAMGFIDGGKQNYQISGYAGSEAERYANDNELKFKILEPDQGLSGKCGLEVNWSFDRDTGTLTIAGTGRMYDYAAAECLPWYDLRQEITAAVVGEGVSSVGEYAFSDSAVEQILLPQSLKWVGDQAFAHCADLMELTFPGDAPEFGGSAFENTTLTAWYPAFNGTWTEEIRRDYGGDITWRNLANLPFVDVPEGAFYYDAVAWALEQGITNGTDETHFSPNDPCQRAAVVTFLWRAMGKPEASGQQMPFVDVPEGQFYYDAVAWAVERGITSGTDATHFSPYQTCNRAQVVTFLWRAMGCPEPESAATPFTDVEQGSWYAKAVAWAVEEGITKGMSADSFGVNLPCNRAQIVTFLYRTMADQG